jgi:LysR family hydrogen peroxide-inducible transcriptional activator
MNTPPYSLRQLQYLVAVAGTGGFGKAAALCHVSQPALSTQLAALEAVLGVRLFERDRHRVLITAAGEALLPRARRVLAEAEELTSAAQALADPLAGTLRLGVIPTISPYLLPEASPRLQARCPRLAVQWTEERTDALLAALRKGDLDGALLAQTTGLEGLEHRKLGQDPFVLAGPRGHALFARKGPAGLRDLDGQTTLLLEDGHCLRDQALALCGHAHEAGFRATSLSTLVQMVASGAGLTLLPAMSLAVENRRGALSVRPFGDPAPGRAVVLAWRRQSGRAAALEAVASVLAEVVGGKAARRKGRAGAGRPVV